MNRLAEVLALDELVAPTLLVSLVAQRLNRRGLSVASKWKSKRHPIKGQALYGENGGKKMRLFVGQFGCYKATGLHEPREAGWRVRIWTNGKGGPAHDYWFENGQFSTIGEPGDSSVAPAEQEAILNMIAKWEADQRSDNDLQAAA